MRIVQISGAYVGAQKIIERAIYDECIKRGYDANIMYAIGESDAEGVVCYENRLTMLLRRGLRKYIGKNPKFSRLSTIQLIKKLKRFKPDLVHLHVLHNGYVDYELLFSFLSKNKIPVVYTTHDMWAFTGGCYYYTREKCDKFQCGCIDCPGDIKRMDNSVNKTHKYYKLKESLISKLDKVQFVAVSQWVADEMKKGFLNKYPIQVIDNGVPIVFCKDAIETNISDTAATIIISVAATWDERKGIDRILDIAKRLGNKYIFQLVGVASQSIIDSAPENVVFLGYISDKNKLYDLYSKADIHLSASFEETFGMTFVEAAFAGTRSIGYASTAVADTIKGVGGVAVKKFTISAMVRAIEQMVQTPNIKLTQSELNQVTKRYSSETMAKKYCELYWSFLAGKGDGI